MLHLSFSSSSRHRTFNDAILNAMAESASTAGAPGTPGAGDNADLHERIDQLLLVNSAMWELLAEKTGLTENDLVMRIAEIDARDGVADGKMTYSPVKCPQCQRTIFPKQQKCLYCGAARPLDNVFKTI
jgi:hypothetical protein